MLTTTACVSVTLNKITPKVTGGFVSILWVETICATMIDRIDFEHSLTKRLQGDG